MNLHFMPSDRFKEKADKIFEEQKQRILKVIPNAEVHHIGSTAIPGAITKGDLDINVRVKRGDFSFAIDQLKKLYEVNQLENWTDNFASFKEEDNNFGVQLTVIGSDSDDFIKLRDLLIRNPELVEKFNNLKAQFEGKDMEDYRIAKANFFEKLRKSL